MHEPDQVFQEIPTGKVSAGMDLSGLISPEGVIVNLKASSKKQALQELASIAAKLTDLPEREIFDTLLQRERLGSTGVGHGVAIPHGKLARLDRILGLVAKLQDPIDFESVDEQPVDLIFLLLAPEGAGADHLKALARIARVLRDPKIAASMRAVTDASALYTLIASITESNAA